MFIGHYSASLAARSSDRRLPLWVYVGAAQWLDIVWAMLIVFGVEKIAGDPSRTEGLDFTSYPYSHSLLAALLWSALAFIAARIALKADPKSAGLVAVVVFSHWLLDLVVHHQDLPLWPGKSPKLGFALWDLGHGEQAIEIILLAMAGIAWGISQGRWFVSAIFVGIAAMLMIGSGATKPHSSIVSPVQVGLVGLAIYLGMTFVAYLLDPDARREHWNSPSGVSAFRALEESAP